MGKAQEAQPMETAAHGSRRPPTPFRPRGSGAPYRPLPPFFFSIFSLSLSFFTHTPFLALLLLSLFFFYFSLFCSYSFSTVFTSGCLLRFRRRFFLFFFSLLSLSLSLSMSLLTLARSERDGMSAPSWMPHTKFTKRKGTRFELGNVQNKSNRIRNWVKLGKPQENWVT